MINRTGTERQTIMNEPTGHTPAIIIANASELTQEEKEIAMALLGNKGNEPTPAPVKSAAPAPVKAAAAAPAKRGPKPGSKREALSLNLDGLVVTTVTDPQEMAKARRTRGERSPEQKRLDAMVEAAWKAWKEAGEPTEWPRMPGVKLRIPEAAFETLQAGIRKAGNFYDLKVRFGRPVKDGGNVEIVFVVTDRPQNDDDDDDDNADNADNNK